MNFKTTLSLLVVLVAVLGVSYYLGVFSSNGGKPVGGRPPVVDAEKILLIAPQLKDVVRVRLEVSGRGNVVFEKKGENWQIVKPVTVNALSWELTDLVSAFEQAHKLERYNAGKEISLQDAGLDKPTYAITFEEKDRKLTYLVGKNVIASENTYVKTSEGNEIIVVDQNLKAKVKKDLLAYRDKQLWELKKDRISELHFIGRDGKTFDMVKGEDSQWVMVSPVRARAAIDPITNAINALSTVRAEEFAEDKPASLISFGLDKPAWTITAVETETIQPTEKTTQPATTKPAVKRTEHVILVGNQTGLKSDQVFAKLTDKSWVVTIKDEEIKKILPDASAWRNKKVLDLDRNDITSLQISHDGQEVALTKVDQTWKLADGSAMADADSKAVDSVIDTLTGLEAASFIDQPDSQFLKKNKLDVPACTVKITGGKKVEPVELAVGQTTPSGMFRYLKRSGLNYVAAVSNEKLMPLFKSALTYRSKGVIGFNIDHVKSLEIARNRETYKVQRDDRTKPWSVTAPVAALADQDSVKNLLLGMTTLEATDFAGRGNLAAYDLETPAVLVKLVTETPVETPTTKSTTQPAPKPVVQQYTLAISKQGGKFYAVRLDVPNALVAQVPESFFNTASAELLDRRVFANVPTATIDRVEIKRPGAEPVVFEKTGGEWKYPADPVFPVDKDKLEQIVGALAQAKAVRFVEFKAMDKYSLKSPHYKITVSAGKKSWSLSAGQKTDSKGRYAIASEKPWIFELSAEDYGKLDKQLKELAKELTATPAAAEPVGAGMPADVSFN